MSLVLAGNPLVKIFDRELSKVYSGITWTISCTIDDVLLEWGIDHTLVSEAHLGEVNYAFKDHIYKLYVERRIEQYTDLRKLNIVVIFVYDVFACN